MKTGRLLLGLFGIGLLIAVFAILFLSGPSKTEQVQKEKQLIQASDSARAGLPGFLNELQHPKEGQRFAMMARFKTGGGNEYLWIKDPTYRDAKLSGTLDQTPLAAQVRKGDLVTVETTDIVDWMIRDPDGKIRGHFTESGSSH